MPAIFKLKLSMYFILHLECDYCDKNDKCYHYVTFFDIVLYYVFIFRGNNPCNKEKALYSMYSAFSFDRQLPILPERLHSSTFGVWGLNYCVRYGNRWDPSAIITGSYLENTFCTLKTSQKISFTCLFSASSFLSQVFDLLVSVRSIPHGTSTPDLSTLSSSRGLISFRWRNFILRLVSRLDAFSVYPFRT